MPVSVTSKATTAGAWLRIGCSALQPPTAADTVSLTPPSAVNLNAFDSRFFSTCCRRFEVGDHAAGEIVIDLDAERKLAVFGFVPERASDRLQQARGQDLLGIHRHGAGFDLRQVEDVADQVEQVGAGAVDGAGEFDLLGRQIAVRIFGELLAEDQDAVERRAQLVRHVGEEFGLVLRGQRKLGRLFFERAARLFDFLVLSFHLDVALGELLGLLFELFVGLLQFLLLRLQFAGELLGLLQQAFGLHRRLDRVEHDADAVGELFEEGHLRGRERS